MAERLRCARSCPGTHDRDRYWVTIRCRGAERDFPHASGPTSSWMMPSCQVAVDGTRGSQLGSGPSSGAEHACGWSQRLCAPRAWWRRRLCARMRSPVMSAAARMRCSSWLRFIGPAKGWLFQFAQKLEDEFTAVPAPSPQATSRFVPPHHSVPPRAYLLGRLAGIRGRERGAQQLLELRGGFGAVPLAPRDRSRLVIAGEDARRRGERVRTTKWVIEGWDLEAGRGLTSDEILPLLFERRGLRDPRESWAARVRRPS